MIYEEVIEEFMEVFMEEINEANAIKGEAVTSLAEILPRLTKKRLYAMATNYDISGRSKMSKIELVEVLPHYICDMQNFMDSFLITRPDEMLFFQVLLRNSDLEDYDLDESMVSPALYQYLLEKGLIFLFDEGEDLVFVIPEEIWELYWRIDQDQFRGRYLRYVDIYSYVMALTKLYGTFMPELLVDIYNRQNKNIRISMNEFLEIFMHLNKRKQFFDMVEGRIVWEFFATEYGSEDLEAHLLEIEDKPYYIPNRDKLEKYADPIYYEITPQIKALQDFILREMCDDRELVEDLIDAIQLACFLEYDLQQIFHEFEKREIFIKDSKQLEQLVTLIVDVKNNTRLWANCGHTPNEINRIMGLPMADQSNLPRKVKKIGRNEPCPCGSGKKYKKCCGR